RVLIGPVAMATSRIRVGSGGVMLPHYSPLHVAESFSILAGLYPDRIDLALGRAPGTDQLTMLALQRARRQPAPAAECARSTPPAASPRPTTSPTSSPSCSAISRTGCLRGTRSRAWPPF